MRGRDDGSAAGALGIHEGQVALAAGGIQPGGGLIQKEQPGIPAHGLCQVHPLALAAGQRAQRHVRQVADAHGVHGVVHQGIVIRPQATGQPARGPAAHAHHIPGADGQQEPLLVGLRQVRHAHATRARVAPLHLQRARHRRDEPGDGAKQRALARAVGADHREPAPRRERQVDAPDHRMAVVPHGQVTALDGRCHACSGCGRRAGTSDWTTATTKKMATAVSTTVAPAARSRYHESSSPT